MTLPRPASPLPFHMPSALPSLLLSLLAMASHSHPWNLNGDWLRLSQFSSNLAWLLVPWFGWTWLSNYFDSKRMDVDASQSEIDAGYCLTYCCSVHHYHLYTCFLSYYVVCCVVVYSWRMASLIHEGRVEQFWETCLLPNIRSDCLQISSLFRFSIRFHERTSDCS